MASNASAGRLLTNDTRGLSFSSGFFTSRSIRQVRLWCGRRPRSRLTEDGGEREFDCVVGCVQLNSIIGRALISLR